MMHICKNTSDNDDAAVVKAIHSIIVVIQRKISLRCAVETTRFIWTIC